MNIKKWWLITRAIFSSLAVFAVSATSAYAGTCPALGNITDCTVIITVEDNGVYVTVTGQGPYDGSDDITIGVVNNSSQPVRALGLASQSAIFGFEGDGMDAYGIAGNSYDMTGYGGPNAYFSNPSNGFPSLTSGTVNFITPIPAKGGTGYFSLEAPISTAISCSLLINGAVPPPNLTNNNRTINASFTPNLGYSLQQAAQLCGFVDFDWQQKVTVLPLPSPFKQLGNPVPLSAPPAFLDPPPNGYEYELTDPQYQNGDHSYPFYYDIHGELANYEHGGMTLTFRDMPADACLPGGTGNGCSGAVAPDGSYIGFVTHLVGVNADGTPTDLGVGFNWTSTFNGTSGGVSTTKNALPPDPGSGTGGITVTCVQKNTHYQYQGMGVTSINGVKVTGMSPGATPPVVTIAATPAEIWPPNGMMEPVTVSGTITDKEPGGCGIDPGTVRYSVKDEYGEIQPSANIRLGTDGKYSFAVELQAWRRGDDKDGRQYTITVTAADFSGSMGSASVTVVVPHDQRR